MKIYNRISCFENLNSDLFEIYEKSKNTNPSIVSINLSNLITKYKFDDLELESDLIFLSSNKIEKQVKKIKEEMEVLVDKMFYEKSKPSIFYKHSEIKDLKKFLMVDEPESFNKIQKLSSLIKENTNAIYEKFGKKSVGNGITT